MDWEVLGALTRLVAAHGVYALSVIFIFVAWRRAQQSLSRAPEADKPYFRVVHASVVVTTYALVGLASLVWIYATFVYLPVRPIKGEVTGLRAPESGLADAVVDQQLAPELPGDLDFYTVPSFRNGAYVFKWAVLAREDVEQVAFIFTQRAEVPAEASWVTPVLAGLESSPGARGRKVTKIEKRFVLDLGAIGYSPTKAIHLTYRPDDVDPTGVGTLWLRQANGGQPTAIPWADGAAPALAKSVVDRLHEVLFPAALAEGDAIALRSDGSYEMQAAERLQLQLASADLRVQLAARSALVEHGERAFRLVLDMLEERVAAPGVDRAALVDSLARSVDEIERTGSRFPARGHLALAVALYEAANVDAAAAHFQQAEVGRAPHDALQIAMRAHAYLEAQRFPDAIRSLNEYLAAGVSRAEQAWARDNLGYVYAKLGRRDDSIRERREALRLSPNSPLILNNLAYELARRGDNPREALPLVDRALRQQPENPYFIETRGYVLFRLGRLDEAVTLIRQAAAALPGDADTKRDLAEVEQAIRARGVKRASAGTAQ